MLVAPRARRRLLVGAGIVALLVGLYAAAGYLLAPSLIRDALIEQAARTGLEARFGAIATHPFVLALDAYDVQLSTRAGRRIAYAQRLAVELGWASLWRRGWVLDRVALDRPVLTAWPALDRGGAGSSAPQFVLHELQVENGILALDNAPRLEQMSVAAREISSSERPASFSASAQIAGGGAVRMAGSLVLQPVAIEGKMEVHDASLAAAWRYLPEIAGDAPKGALRGTLEYRYAGGRFTVANAAAQARLQTGGSVAARGGVAVQPFAVDLHVEVADVPLALAQRFLPQSAQVHIARGALSGEGRLRLGASAGYAGTASVRNARIEDGEGGLLIAWEQLTAEKLDLGFSPFAAQAEDVLLAAPSGEVVIGPKGELNLAQLLPPARQGGAAGERPRIEAARLRIERGELAFADRSLDTPFATSVRELSGVIAGISTVSDEPARVQLTGRVGRYGDARVRGTIDLDAPATRTGLQVRFRNLALADFTPYAAKFAGYRIAGGRLSAELRYRVRDGRLVGDNELVFDKLQLGEKVESASALDLPVDLAVALLTDANGRINLAIPVRGDLRDPQFDLGGLIAKAVRNTLGKIVAAPFRLLASLFGGEGEGLDEVRFDAGSAALTPPEEESIAHIAQALAERPQLVLSIRGGYDSEADAQALRRQALFRQLAGRAAEKAAGAGASAPIDPGDPTIVRAAERLYLRRGGDAFGLGQLKPRAPGYARRLFDALAKGTDIAPDAPQALAQRRAEAVRAALIAAGVAGERLSIAPPADARAAEDGVPTELSVRAG